MIEHSTLDFGSGHALRVVMLGSALNRDSLYPSPPPFFLKKKKKEVTVKACEIILKCNCNTIRTATDNIN